MRIKRISVFVFTMIVGSVVLLSLFACEAKKNNTEEDGLEEYKENKTEELQTYADAKGEGNYSVDGWLAVCSAIAEGKAAIAAQSTKLAVTIAFNEAIKAINKVEKDIRSDRFYTLQEAYDKEMLTVENLQSIAGYHEANTSTSEEINPENANRIKEIAARIMREDESDPVDDAKAEDFSIIRYYGCYNGSVVFMIDDPYHMYPAVELDINEVIAGISFYYIDPNRILVWKR